MTDSDNGIRIGEKAWLAALPIRGPKTIDLDPRIEPLVPFFSSFETECSKGCCGISAFAFTPKQIKEAVLTDPLGRAVVLSKLNEILAALSASDADSLCPTPFDSHVNKTTFEQLIRHILTHAQKDD